MLKRYMHKRERYFAMLNDNRTVQPFAWGEDFAVAGAGSSPAEILKDNARRMIADSDHYFTLSDRPEFQLETRLYPRTAAINPDSESETPQFEVPILSWNSAVSSPDDANNTAFAAWFPHETNKKAAVIVLPHWNARAGTYFDLCRFFNKVGLSALRLTLPYHEERMPPELERADHLVSPNIGRTLQSVQQAVLDTQAAIAWLRESGYEKIGIVGTSIGSCVAFMAFVHNRNIDAAVFNHVSGYMADVVWHGLSTYHVREGIGGHIGLDELREYWMPVSPMAYMSKLAKMPPRPQHYIYTLYDLSFPVELSRDTMKALKAHKIEHDRSSIPCGHYTLGEKPWVWLDGYKIIRYMHRHLR